MNDIITRKTPIGEAAKILESHGVPMGKYWELALGMLLSEVGAIKVEGVYNKCAFKFDTEETRQALELEGD